MDYRKLAENLLRGGDQHSDVFIAGMGAAIRIRIEDEITPCPYPEGSLEFDAWYYGCQRGYNEFRNALIEANGDREQAIARLRTLAGNAERRAA